MEHMPAQFLPGTSPRVSLRQFNENVLASVLLLAYHCALEDWLPVREFPSGRGFADIVMLPKRKNRIPIVAELKCDTTVDAAIQQIKDRRHVSRLAGYPEVLLVGISYDRKSKEHTCAIERWPMT